VAVALVTAALVAIGGFGFAAFEGFVTPAPWQLALLGVAAVFLACGYTLIVMAMRIGEISASAPFRYSVLVFALISGMTVFHEFPDGWAATGMALIVATGLITARREALTQR
jgi:drug/metabolite transporter (DMT)-like permease